MPLKNFTPLILDPVFNNDDFNKINNIFYGKAQYFDHDPLSSRYFMSSSAEPRLNKYHRQLLATAQTLFTSKTLLPTYSIFVHYEGENSNLWKHKDINACTYTLDVCLYQKTAWPLWVENIPYALNPNQGLAYCGVDQEHWREDMPNKSDNHVALVLFHFAEPDHWYFTKGPDYIHQLRK